MARRRRGLIAIALATVGSVTMIVDAPGSATAARRTKSASIAAAAGQALEAIDQWTATQQPADYVRFVQSRELTAELTAADLEVDGSAMRSAWSAAPADKQRALLAAMSQLGVPYGNLESEPGVAFDCSGLTIWAYGVAGVELPRVSGDQIEASESIERADAEPGDLVYYPGHVGIYLGEETYVHSPNSGSHVEAVHLPDKSLRFGDSVAAAESAEPAQSAGSATARPNVGD